MSEGSAQKQPAAFRVSKHSEWNGPAGRDAGRLDGSRIGEVLEAAQGRVELCFKRTVRNLTLDRGPKLYVEGKNALL